MKNLISLFLAVLALALLNGCQNPYAVNYKNALTPALEPYLLPHTGTVEIQPADFHLPRDRGTLERRGYLVIGLASFTADNSDYTPELKARAQEVQADIVLTTTTLVSQSSGNESTPGPRLGADYGNRSSTPAPGRDRGATSATEYSRTSGFAPPVLSSDRGKQYTYVAVFLRKRAFVLGANVDALSAAQQAAVAPKFGVAVISVIDDSPATRAGLRAGDLITAVEGEPFTSPEEYQTKLNARAGGSARLTLLRGGTETTVAARLNPRPARR